jgi:UDP-N-acetylmuramyl pentapeptide synthase
VDKLMYKTFDTDNIEADIYFDSHSFKKWKENADLKSHFSLHIKDKKYEVETNLFGKMNYGYIGVAIWIAETLAYQWKSDLNLPDKKKLELTYKLQPGRLSVFDWKHNTLIIDSTYNASPLSVRKTIDTVYTIRNNCFPKSEIWLVLWDMRELGDLTESEHRKLAGYVSQSWDQLFLLGKSMNEYLADELDKIWATNNLTVCKTLKELNKTVENKLKEKSDKNPVILVFKWSQNTIFLEEAVKHFLKNKQDEELLTRQSEFRMKKKNEFLK